MTRLRVALAASGAAVIAGSAVASVSPAAETVAVTRGLYAYVVSPNGAYTDVTQLRAADRTAIVNRRIAGRFGLPAVPGEAGREGLSRDGGTLVAAERPRNGATRFAVFDARRLRLRRVVALRGAFGYDAMSPDGSTLYVIHYLSRDRTHYAVQAMTTAAAKPSLTTVVEKGEPGEKMGGLPISRATSPDGRWVYTLYDGAGKTPFVHALATADRFTVCIDVHRIAGRSDLTSLHLKLSPDARTLNITDKTGRPLALVDTQSYQATKAPTAAAAPAPQKRRPATETKGTNTQAITAIAVASALVLTAAATTTRRRRHSRRRRAEQA
jgi:DNA-binding beta-propeller fold protein YncE